MNKPWSTARTVLASACVLMIVEGAAYAYDALQRPTELQYWDASRACNGYTLFGPGHNVPPRHGRTSCPYLAHRDQSASAR